MKTEQIAKVCHEANRAYCNTLGDYTHPIWEEAPDWHRASVIKGVEQIALRPGMSPRDSHDGWMAEKIREGWQYGAVKDTAKKLHPCLVPWEMLSTETRAKDVLFVAVARALLVSA